ncbi:hypothetical protein BJ138DRAFT_1003906 [Hygrophoropsis aurantiaca]|uniref:Uncharacterized protein n=1 Tax=Hygrophoropsis aurantiaca TaxID=72124 RepID=A0ACB8AHM0_9AGAM|nr:hypothetical protein BJ138DRAFT_1003906 [Hygrophoropsis aurantiaca]
MAESMEASFAFEKRDTPTEEQTAASQKIANAVGTNVVFFLQSKQHKDDPILIQIAFQAFFAVYLRWLSQTWIIGDRAHDQFLDTVYSRIRNSEAQAIAGRWRALTRAHIQPTQLDESQSTATLVTAIVDGLSSILIAAGCTAPRQDLCDALSKKFNDKIALMIGLAIRINRIIGEDVTSGNLEIVAIQSAAPFDKNNMEDAYEDGHTEPTNSRVLCPTDLGLRRLTRAAINGQSHWEEKLLLKPKVALESVVDNMDD